MKLNDSNYWIVSIIMNTILENDSDLSIMSRIQINNNAILLYIAWRDGKAFYCCAGTAGTVGSAGAVVVVLV